MFWRGLKGAMLGAVIMTTVAIMFVLLGLGIEIFLVSKTPIERSDAVDSLRRALLLMAVVGVILGALGGLASRLPRHGMNMLPSISIMALFGIVGWMMGLGICGGKDDLVILVFLGMSLVGSVVVYLYGRNSGYSPNLVGSDFGRIFVIIEG